MDRLRRDLLANSDNSFDAVFFDFDGVLVDSVDVKTQAFRELYSEHGEVVQDRVAAHHLANGGISRFEKIRFYEEQLIGRTPTDDDVDRLAGRFAEIVVEQVVAAVEIPGAVRTLEYFATRCPLFVVSGTPQDELEQIVSARGWDGYFRELRGSPKPKDHHLIELIQNFSLCAPRCLMIGDAETDRKAASLTGVPFLGVAGRDRSHPFADEVTVVDDLNQIFNTGLEAVA